MSNRSLSIAAGVVVLLVIGFLWAGRTVSDDKSIESVGGASRSVSDREETSSDAPHRESDQEQKTLAPESRATIVEATDDATHSSSGPASLVVTAVWADDGVPAAQMRINLLAWSDADPFAQARATFTDGDGRARFEDVSPGQVAVGAVLGGGTHIEVRQGMTETVELRLDPGILVRGLVVDAEGRPVLGAEICAADIFDDFVVARTGGDGRFTLRGGDNGMNLSARSSLSPPSKRYSIWGKKGDTVDVTMTLSGKIAHLYGRVLDEQGHPVVNARVFVGERRRVSVDLGGGKWGTSPPPVLALTDQDGKWSADGQTSPYVPLLVRAVGFAPWTSLISTTSGDLEIPDIRLDRGVVVFGIARLASGAPVAQASVRNGEYGDLESCMTRTDAEGAFRVVDLPKTCTVTVSKGNFGRATKDIAAAPGDEVEWNPILDDGALIRGIVIDEASRPRVDWMIEVGRVDVSSSWRGQTTTDSEGRFVVRNCETGIDLYLELREPKQWMQHAVRRLQPLRPDGPDIEIRVPADDLPSVYVTGRVVDEDGAPVAAGTIAVWSDGERSTNGHALDKDGGFSIGPISPGPRSLNLWVPTRPTRSLGRFEFVRDQHLDLGVIQLERPGRAILEPTDPDRADLGKHYISLCLDRVTIDAKFADGRWTSSDAAPGDYEIRCWHDGKPSTVGTVTITSGATSTVRIDVDAGKGR